MAFATTMSGINIIMIYGYSILQNIEATAGGQSIISPKSGSYILGSCSFFGSVSAGFGINYFKRRTLMVRGHVLMFICLVLVGLFVELNNASLSLLFMALFIVIFQISMGPIPFLYIAEIANDQALGLSLTVMVLFMTVQSFVTEGVINVVGITNFFYFFGAF